MVILAGQTKYLYLSESGLTLPSSHKNFVFCGIRLNALAFVGQGLKLFMFYTYVLMCIDKSKNREKLYIGSTSNLRKRLIKHKSKSIKTTKSFDIIELVYYEACRNKTDSRKRELQLKTGFGRGYLKRRLENDLYKRA